MNKFTSHAERRQFLKQCAALSSLGCAGPLAMALSATASIAATSATDYKALVCIFLHGGNDAFNTVLPTDAASWAAYASVRNQQPESIALLRDMAAVKTSPIGSPSWLGGVLPIRPISAKLGGRTYALHPMLTDVRSSFERKRLAILANVGPLVEPITKDEYVKGNKSKPKKLFSHNDQQSTWMALAPEGATAGWGGRLVDLLATNNSNSLFAAMSLSGNSVWVSGQTIKQYQLAQTGPIRMGATGGQGGMKIYGSDLVGAALEQIVTTSRDKHFLTADLADIARRSITAERTLSNALPSPAAGSFGSPQALQYSSLNEPMQLNSFAQQLQTIARVIAAHQALGIKRQVFFVSVGGFDTHNTQNRNHAALLSKLNHGLQYFDMVLNNLGLANQVTTFTASDFGRSFTSNGDGTDHGWGGHHMIMGGAVQGGEIYGDFPIISIKNSYNNDFDASPDQLTNGVLLPKVSVDQYGATLGRWFGVSDSDLDAIFPNLQNFSSFRNLGFMRL